MKTAPLKSLFFSSPPGRLHFHSVPLLLPSLQVIAAEITLLLSEVLAAAEKGESGTEILRPLPFPREECN